MESQAILDFEICFRHTHCLQDKLSDVLRKRVLRATSLILGRFRGCEPE